MKAIRIDARTIVLFGGEVEVSRLTFRNRFSSKAEITDAEKQMLSIEPANIWHTVYDVKKGEKTILSFHRKWNGNSLIKTFFDTNNQEYTFKHQGFFKSKYLLLDKDSREMIEVKPELNWRKLRYNYHIVISDSMKRRPGHHLLAILTVYLCKEFISRQASHGAIAAS